MFGVGGGGKVPDFLAQKEFIRNSGESISAVIKRNRAKRGGEGTRGPCPSGEKKRFLRWLSINFERG